MKRKYLSLGLALVMALTLCACGGGAVNGTSTGKEDGKLASGTWQQQETGDTEGLQKASQRLRAQKQKYSQYSKDCGLGTHFDRTQVYGYDRSKSAKTVWAERKAEKH